MQISLYGTTHPGGIGMHFLYVIFKIAALEDEISCTKNKYTYT